VRTPREKNFREINFRPIKQKITAQKHTQKLKIKAEIKANFNLKSKKQGTKPKLIKTS